MRISSAWRPQRLERARALLLVVLALPGCQDLLGIREKPVVVRGAVYFADVPTAGVTARLYASTISDGGSYGAPELMGQAVTDVHGRYEIGAFVESSRCDELWVSVSDAYFSPMTHLGSQWRVGEPHHSGATCGATTGYDIHMRPWPTP